MGIVYLITTSKSDRCYVGITIRSLQERFDEHIRASRKRRKSLLGAAIRKHGANTFTIECIEVCNDAVLVDREIYWIAKLGTHVQDGGYNLTHGGEGTRGFRHVLGSRAGRKNSFWGKHHTAETRNKISTSLKQRFDRIGRKPRTRSTDDERRKKLSESLKRRWKTHRHPRLGKRHTVEARERMRFARLGRKHTDETRAKISASNLGKHRGPLSIEHRQALSKAAQNRKREPRAVPVLQVSLSGDVITQHDCIRDVCRSLGTTNRRMIIDCCEHRRISAYGYQWFYLGKDGTRADQR